MGLARVVTAKVNIRVVTKTSRIATKIHVITSLNSFATSFNYFPVKQRQFFARPAAITGKNLLLETKLL